MNIQVTHERKGIIAVGAMLLVMAVASCTEPSGGHADDDDGGETPTTSSGSPSSGAGSSNGSQTGGGGGRAADGGAGGAAGGGGGPAEECLYLGSTTSTDCAGACEILFCCAEPRCDGLTPLDKAPAVAACIELCLDAGGALQDAVQGDDCANTVALVATGDITFADACANGL